MRRLYVIMYDISNPKRLRKIFKIMRGVWRPVAIIRFPGGIDSQRTGAINHEDQPGDSP